MGFNEYEFSKLRAQRHAENVKRRQEIYDIRHANDPDKKKISFGKILVGFIFIDCLIIQAFIMYMLFLYADTSQMSSLIGLVCTLVVQGISLHSYNYKSAKENTTGGVVYETVMFDKRNESIENPSSSIDNNEIIINEGTINEEEAVG